MDDIKKKLGFGLGFSSIVTGLYALDPVKFTEYFSLAMQQEISRILIGFTVAAWIHSARVKKQFEGVTGAINGLGNALRQDLSALSRRVGDLENKLVKKGEENVQA